MARRIGTFTPYQPELPSPRLIDNIPGVLFLKDESGNDWYDLVKILAKINFVYVGVDTDNTVMVVTEDPETLFPNHYTLYQMHGKPNQSMVGKKFDPVLQTFTAIPVPKTWTPLEFKELFTPDERKKLRQLAKTDDLAEDWLDLLNAAQLVRLDDERTTNGLKYMVLKGVLSQTRVNEIIS